MTIETSSMKTREEIQKRIRELKVELESAFSRGLDSVICASISCQLEITRTELKRFEQINGKAGWANQAYGRACHGPI